MTTTDDDDLVQIDTRYATVGDFEAHARHQLARARNQVERAEAQQALRAAAIVLERARGNRAARLIDFVDRQH
jgi:hypothetical protein